MKRYALCIIALLASATVYSQIAKDWMIGASMDIVKSDYDAILEKVQGGAEVNYFLSRKFTVTGGFEYWSAEGSSAVMGARWYPIREAFIRVRGLIGANDIAVGGGWAKPINENWRFEAMGDFYAAGNIAIRGGFVYIIRRKHKE